MGDLISVVVPAYNVGPYLENCLNSILNQTYPNLEILLVDDGSTDNTGVIADSFQVLYPDRVHVVHTANRGVTMARFEGIRMSRGEWIGFVDGDDEIEKDMYERLYRNAVQFNADISHCGHRTIVNGGERIHDFYNTGRLARQNRQEGLRDLLEGTFEPSLCTKLFRSFLLHRLLQSGRIDPAIKYNEDVLMNYYLFQEAENTVLEDFCGYHYQARSTSATRGNFRIEKVLDPVKVRKKILDDVEPELKGLAWQKYLSSCSGAYACLAVRADKREEAREFKNELLRNRDNWCYLSRNERIKLNIMLFSPSLYSTAYRFYEKHFQKKVYE